MAGYLWLVWYEAPARAALRHWTLAVTYEANDRAYATVYEVGRRLSLRSRRTSISRVSIQVMIDLSGYYQSRVTRRVHLTSNHPSGAYSGKILLGEINDNVLCSLEAYSETAAELVNSRNRKRGPGSQTCHDWAIIIVRSLEDSMLLPQVSPTTSEIHRRDLTGRLFQGALTRAEKCPRVG